MIKKYLLILLLIISTALSVSASQETVDKIEQQLRKELASTRSQKDSVRILYDLYDLVPRKEKLKYSTELYNLFVRMGDHSRRLDLLRNMSQISSSIGNPDSVFRYLSEEVAKVPRSQEQEETALFIRMRQVAHESRVADARKCEMVISQLIAEEPQAKDLPINHRVLRLFTIVEYLTNSGVEGPLLGEYVGMLKERMNQANFKLYALNNILLTESANIYTTIGSPKEAVEADRQLLKVIENLEKKYHTEGRDYRNYDANKYIIYRRMLNNYSALTPEEIEEYYGKIQSYMEDEDVFNTENNTHLAELAYAMGTKNYVKAIPLIRKTLETETRPARRRKYVKWLQIAAEGVGDKDTEIEALKLYNAMLVERDTSSSSDRSKELAIRTRVSELKADNTYLQIEKEKEEKEGYQRMMSFVMIGWLIFAGLLIILLVLWGKYRSATVRTRQFVENLDNECGYLREQHYYDYAATPRNEMRVDLNSRKVVHRRQRSRSIISMLNYILNDILYISSIGRVGRGKFVRGVNINDVVEKEVDYAKQHLSSGAQLDIIYPEDEIEVRTDKECLEYVLHHIFFAANRVAEGGIISLEVKESRNKDRVDFIFTNSSVVVEEGHEDVIFDNFIDIEKMENRNDSGLFLARLSGLLIDSTLYLDKDFKDGSRYIFSISKHLGR